MNQEIYNLLSGFRTLKEFSEFLNEVADGEQISRGMTDKMSPDSKQKKQVVAKEVQKKSDGSSTETHYDHIDPEVEQAPEEPPAPIQPGMQVQFGNKEVDDEKATALDTVPVEISGDKEGVETKPKIDLKLSK